MTLPAYLSMTPRTTRSAARTPALATSSRVVILMACCSPALARPATRCWATTSAPTRRAPPTWAIPVTACTFTQRTTRSAGRRTAHETSSPETTCPACAYRASPRRGISSWAITSAPTWGAAVPSVIVRAEWAFLHPATPLAEPQQAHAMLSPQMGMTVFCSPAAPRRGTRCWATTSAPMRQVPPDSAIPGPAYLSAAPQTTPSAERQPAPATSSPEMLGVAC